MRTVVTGSSYNGYFVTVSDDSRFRFNYINVETPEEAEKLAIRRFDVETQYTREDNINNCINAIIALQGYINYLETEIKSLKEGRKK